MTDLGGIGIGLQAAGAVNAALGAYFSVKASQYQAEAQASSLDFQQTLSERNARAAERDAQATILAGQREAGRIGMRYRQMRGELRARQAAAGIQRGVGSAAELAASLEYANQADQLAITRSSVRAANAYRTRGVNAATRGRMQGVSAANLRASADSMSPWLAGGSSLLASGGRVAHSWYQYDQTR